MELEDFIPELLNLAQGADHDDSDCPQDDTCECENIFNLNEELKNIQKLLNPILY
jgi:hypothetical protein